MSYSTVDQGHPRMANTCYKHRH